LRRKVLNAFRHQRMVHCSDRRITAGHWSVLNAFRHQRMVHTRLSECCGSRRQCSTPFGINEWFTTSFKQASSRPACAQRLSASTNGSQVDCEFRLPGHQCSTPFGINEWFTFGHDNRPQESPCAQRLSASTNGSPQPVVTGLLKVLMCSTPFGINEWFTRCASRFGCIRSVLNAFRHQRMVHEPTIGSQLMSIGCSTPFGINEWFTAGPSAVRNSG